jgi:regulator of replication initiation timing
MICPLNIYINIVIHYRTFCNKKVNLEAKIEKLEAEVKRLEAENKALRIENAQLKERLSLNSSLPSSNELYKIKKGVHTKKKSAPCCLTLLKLNAF